MLGLLGFNPYAILAGVVIVLALFTGTYVKGRIDGREVCQERIAVLQADAYQAAQAELGRAIVLSTQLEAHRVQIQTKYRTITRTVEKVVEKPLYRGVCFDDDGVRLINTALTSPLTPPSKPRDTMPTPPHPE